jgi:hypothetical protein
VWTSARCYTDKSAPVLRGTSMPSVLIFVVSCLVLLVDVVFITATTEFNLLIVIPAVLSATYLAYSVAHGTILP